MQKVADHLHNYAKDNQISPEASFFIRSACNRYYYYVFLEARSELRKLIGTEDSMRHNTKGIQHFRKNYITRIPKQLRDAGKNDIADLIAPLFNDLNTYVGILYHLRWQSDYFEPEIYLNDSDEFEIKVPTYKKQDNYKMSYIAELANNAIDIITQLGTYRKMAGF